MGISNVKTSKDLSSAIYYMLNGKGHDGSSQRYVSTRFENLTLAGAIQQTKAVREHFNKDKNVHGLTFIFSFSDKEIHYQDSVQQEKMMDSLHEVMKERFPNRQFGLVGQTDGDGKKFHIHAFVNSPDLTTGKLLDGRVKLHEHSKEMLTEAMDKANIQDLNKDVQTKQAKKTNIAVQKIKSKNPNSYIWLEDLQNRISKSVNDPTVMQFKDFEEHLFLSGVTVKARKSKKTESGWALSYKFTDEDGKERTVRASRLGTDFQFEHIKAIGLERKRSKEEEERKAEAERKRAEADRVRRAKAQETVSKPSVSIPRVKPLVQKQNGSEKLSEPRRTILETQPNKSIPKPVQAKIEPNKPVLENPLLNYIKTAKFVMWHDNGKPIPSLGNEKRTFKEHSEIRAGKPLNDAVLLKFAEKIKFTVPSKNWEGKFICNSKPTTLLERFEKSVSDKDLLDRFKKASQEQQFQTQKQDTVDFER